MSKIAEAELTQDTDLMFGDQNFYRILAGLPPLIAGLPFTLDLGAPSSKVSVCVSFHPDRGLRHFLRKTLSVRTPHRSAASSRAPVGFEPGLPTDPSAPGNEVLNRRQQR
jgi:hypothetical protein